LKVPAVVFDALNQVSVRDVEVPAPGPGEVQVKTHLSVISPGTETWVLKGVFTWQPTQYPCVPGYQRVGTVIALGEGVTGWTLGDRVAATSATGPQGIASMWGSHAAVANTVAEEIYRVPENVNSIDAASFVVAQVGYNAAFRATIAPNKWLAVFGDGVIGQMAAQAAKARGAKVVLIGHRQERLEAARRNGIDLAVDGYRTDLSQHIRSQTSTEAILSIIDTVQGEAVQQQTMDILPPRRGEIVYAGFSSTSTWTNMAHLQQREVTAHFISGWTHTRLGSTLDLMSAKQLQFRSLVTHHVPATEAPAMYELIRNKEASLGIVLDWSHQ